MTDRGVGGDTRKRKRERGDPKRMDLFPLVQAKGTGQDRTGRGKGAKYVQQQQQQDRNCSRQAARQVRAAQKGTNGREGSNECLFSRQE